MNLNELRRDLAAALGTTDAALLARQKAISPVMKLGAEPNDAFRQGVTVPATPRNAAFLTLTAMLGGPPKTIGERVERMWKAHFEQKGKACPVSGATTLGKALVTLIERSNVREKLAFIEIIFEYQSATLAWRDAPPSTFHPHTGREWQKKKMDALTSGGLTRIARLGAPTFAKIAGLIERP